ncbi:uncharacterized protein LOC130922856 [Corythoichthys intestinalis]|uniref:uncharacterized protein LOC130922856 n=1 Tax=Corythoichthys intestinalis TaxID=161448 RepID=UPI0025A5ABB4|nr:uncharacterized protein LOC130922856 [Corythoichthys intestinalis]
MEPDILTYKHAVTGPPLDDDIREAGSDEEAFRGFSRGLADPPFRLRFGFRHQSEPSPLTNRFRDAPGEGAGFAAFGGQAAHPWCCGFAGATTSSNVLKETRDVIMDSEPGPSHRCLHLKTEDTPRVSSASEEQDSISLEGPSEDSEPNVSSLASFEDSTDDEQMMDDVCSASQGTCPTSNLSSKFFADDSRGCQSLPPSDSFADFCSAATQQDLGETWARINDRGDHMQQLLQASFPQMVLITKRGKKEEDEAEEVPNLEALLRLKQLLDCEKGTAERARPGFCLPSRHDPCDATGLKFKWGTSHANRTLLSCLGVLDQPKKDSFPTPILGPLYQPNATDQSGP